jgi:hypothetical protein
VKLDFFPGALEGIAAGFNELSFLENERVKDIGIVMCA